MFRLLVQCPFSLISLINRFTKHEGREGLDSLGQFLVAQLGNRGLDRAHLAVYHLER